MSAKVIFVFCAQALFIQLALSSCVGGPTLGAGLASYGLSSPITPGLGLSGCAGPVLSAPGCSGLGYNGIGYGNAGLGYGSGIGYGTGLDYGSGLGYGSNLGLEVISTSGGSLPVTSSSSISPTGISIVSENVFEGTLYVDGELPFVSAVALEGDVSSGGAGIVSHSCGNGVTDIESIAPSTAAAVVPANAGIGALGTGIGAYGAGIGAYGAGVAPLSLLPGAGCNAPVAGIVAPIDGCYPPGTYY